MRHRLTYPTTNPGKLQRGIAAVEFALLVLFLMVPFLLGIFVFWEVLQTQQVVTRATGDGARQVVRLLQGAKVSSSNDDDHVEAQAAALARASISAALRSHLGDSAEIDSRLTVTLQPSDSGQWVLDVRYARPPLLGHAAGLNFIEPEALYARNLIQWP